VNIRVVAALCKKKRFPYDEGAALLVMSRYLESMVMIAVAFSGIQDCFDNTVGHAQSDD
jgi:hypothetical protein